MMNASTAAPMGQSVTAMAVDAYAGCARAEVIRPRWA
jgi:hypothetical protein